MKSAQQHSGTKERCSRDAAVVKFVPRAVVTAIAVALAGPLAAQERVETVTVTANKRKEALQEVPLSVKAITGAELERRGSTSLEDALPGEPSVVFTRASTGLERSIAIRGVSDGASAGLTQSTVAIYLDEMPTSVVQANGNIDVALYDIDKVTIVRGPRSTLYGSASLGGTLKIETRNPNLSQREGYARLGLSRTANAEKWNSEAVASISAPLSAGQTAIGLTVYRSYQAGYIDHPTLGKGVNDVTTAGARVALYTEPTRQLSVAVKIYAQDIDGSHGGQFVPGSGLVAKPTTILEPWGDTLRAGNVAIRYKFQNLELLSSSTYFDKRAPYRGDYTAFFSPFGPVFGLAADQLYISNGSFNSRVVAQEFRLQTTESARGLVWSAGAFYSAENTINNSSTLVPVIGEFFGGAARNSRKQTALFGELGYKWANGWSTNVGLRYTEYKADDTIVLTSFGVPNSTAASFKETPVTPHLSLSYATSGDLYYAQASKGFRQGKTNFPVFIPPGSNFTYPPFARSDSLWTYEVGSKSTLWDGRVTLNTAAYLTKWNNPQLTLASPLGFTYIDGLGRLNPGAGIEVRGFEVEFAARPVSAVRVSAGLGYVDSTFTKPSVGLDPIGTTVPAGTRVVGIPKITGNLSLRHELQLGSSPAFWGLVVKHVGDYDSSYSTAPGVNRKLGNYTSLDLNAGVSLGDFDLTTTVINASNTRPLVTQSIVGTEALGTIRPRTIGVSLKYVF